MWDTEKIINSKNAFIGVMSYNHNGEGRGPSRKHIENYFDNGGGMLYICSKEKKEQCINYLQQIWKFDLNQLLKNNRLIFMCRENFRLGDNIDINGFINTIKRCIDLLTANGSNKNQVYINLDSFWNSIDNNNMEYIYDSLKMMSKEGKSGFILRYIMDDINRNYINCMLNKHDFILIDRVDRFEYLTPAQLVQESLTLFSKYNIIDDRYEKEVTTSEYLKNLGELMEGTIHDINNLLVTILGYAELSLFLNDKKEIKEHLQIISKTALDGKSIIDRIKNNIKGSYESLKDIYQFNYIINNSLEMIKHKFKLLNKGNKNMRLVVDLNSKHYIYANEYDIRHSVINIILNGIDAMEDKGVLTVKTYDDGNNIVLEVTDTGKGMDEVTLNKIFKPYFTTKGSKGTGLGLCIAKKTFEKHNGKLYVESEVGKGTKFTIYFPAINVKDNIAHV